MKMNTKDKLIEGFFCLDRRIVDNGTKYFTREF